jgi:hypothetical protein
MYVPDATKTKRPRDRPNLADFALDQASGDTYLGRMPMVGYQVGDERDPRGERGSRASRRP